MIVESTFRRRAHVRASGAGNTKDTPLPAPQVSRTATATRRMSTGRFRRLFWPFLIALATPALISLAVAACDKDGFDGDEGPAPAARPTS